MTISRLPFNLSPRLAYVLASALVAWLLTRTGLDLDPELAGALSLAIAGVVGYRAPADDTIAVLGTPSDELLSEGELAHAESAESPTI